MRQPKAKQKPVTAGELMARLESDPQYLARREQAEAKRQRLVEQNQLAEEPIIRDLKVAGFSVESVDELRQSGIKYKRAIPVLLKWLPLVENSAIKAAIIRSLSIPEARVAAGPLMVEAHSATNLDWTLKWAIGSALAVMADDHVFDEIVKFVREKGHGRAREMFALALGRMKNPAAVDVLMELLEDDEVAGHAVMGLGKLKAQRARSHIERFLNHPKSWVRQEATKALAKLK